MSERKYGHRGYQDSGMEKQTRRESIPKKERLEGAPRGRTAGGFGPQAFKCARCGALKKSLGEVEIALDEKCLDCGADLHTCTNCRNFDTSVQWSCREERIPARIPKKDTANECEYFQPKMVRDLAADKSKTQTPDDARKAFDDLFKS